MKTLIQNGYVVTDGKKFRADVLIEDGKIGQVQLEIVCADAQVIDAAGKLIFPGFIDAHTHFDMDNGVMVTADDFDTGTAAAVAGGTTTVLDFATQDKGGSLAQAAESWHGKADGKCHCNYGFHMAITDWNESTRQEMQEMTECGITSYKVYLAYDALRLRDSSVYEVLLEARQQGAIVGAHCENGDLVDVLVKKQLALGHTQPGGHPLSRPDVVEAEAVNRFLDIAQIADCPVNIVHLSTADGMQAICRARVNGQKVYVETCPQYLILDDSRYTLPGFEGAKYVISPPLRQLGDQRALWDAMDAGEIDTIATDHCAFNFKGQKDCGADDFSKIPNGAPGVQTRAALLYTYGVVQGNMEDTVFSELLSENPAKLYGMYPQKGCIAVGSDADIVVWDPRAEDAIHEQTQLSACDYTPYEGIRTVGRADYVFVNGTIVAEKGRLVQPNQGRYVCRKPSLLWR